MPSHATYSGLRVLDLSTNIAGPFAAMILGDLGADVIKIERPPFGDDTRSLPPAWHGQATVFLAVNRNKRSLVLDLKSFGGREALLKLAASADVIIESFPPGLATELALTHEHFRASNPRVTVSSISAFGPGPIGSKMPGYDALVQAVSGMMSFTGDAGGPTVRIAPSLLDLTTGMWAVIAIMAALSRREHDGGGEHLNAVLLDSAFALMCHQVQGFWATGEAPAKLGSAAPSAAPYRVYRAADGEFMLATASNAQFARLCGALELNELAQDARFRTMAGRLTARAELDAILAERLARETVETWLQRLREVGIAAGQVNDLPQALELPVTRERQLFVSSEESGWKQGLPLLRLPIDTETAAIRRAPPALGEHSEEILSSLGYDTTAIARLSAHA
jgi:crotonobetainyl-CoA:carnitine CoA-transferase CaiB-like acyl-CoA transferase